MADRIKNYQINYQITSNAADAARGFNSLLYYVDQLSGKNKYTGLAQGLTALNGEINTTIQSVGRLATAFSEIRPTLDLSGFKTQLGMMQRSVAEFAQQTRTIMRMAMSGTDKQFAKARGMMSGNIFDAASLRNIEEELKTIPQKINDATKAVEKAKAAHTAAINAKPSYPKGATNEEIRDIDKAAQRERAVLLRTLNERERALKDLKTHQDNLQKQAINLRSALGSQTSTTLPTLASGAPKGAGKAIANIPKWEKAVEDAQKKLNAIAQRKGNMPVPSSKLLQDAKMMALKRAMNAPLMPGQDYQQWVAQRQMLQERFNTALQARKDYMAQMRAWRSIDDTNERNALKRAQKRLTAAKSIESQYGAKIGGSTGPLPSILGMSPQILEQTVSGKLLLTPDIAGAQKLIAAANFNANLKLLPQIADLKAKLSAEPFSIKVTPTLTGKASKGKNATTATFTKQLTEELNKANATVGTKLDRTGILGRAKSGYNTLQTLADRHPLMFKMSHDGSGGFALNQALARLSELAKTRPVPFRMVHDGSGGFALNQALARLTELARMRPIPFRMIHDGSGAFSLNQALTRMQALANSRPIMVESAVATTKASKAAVTKAVKSVAGKTKSPSLNVMSPGLAEKINELERFRTIWAELPRRGTRNYTINLKTTGLENLQRIERLIPLINSLPKSVSKNYNVGVGGGGRGGSSGGTSNTYIGGGTSGGRVYGAGKNADMYTRARAWAYPFTGNTSFGAREPAALGMMKGMGMMMGIGGLFGVVGSSLSDAVRYQNTMETAKAILSDNYRGNNFGKDYNEMVRTVRDVAMRTKFTAPEAADAARFMAMAGLDIPMIKSAIAPIADVAAISDADLGEVADKMTNIMTEFKVKPENMRKLADMMTKTFTSTNTDMMMLAESLQYAGPMAFASGQSIAETLAMIGIMGNSGIQASMAGTTMRMMLQNIYNPNKKQQAFMDKIGLKTRDANGNRRSLFDVLSDISKLTGSSDSMNVVGNLLSGKDSKNNIDTFEAASKLFRVTAAAGGASLLGNMDKVAALIAQINGAQGNSAAVSIAKQNTVAGLWAQAKSAFTEAVVKVFEDNDMQNLIKNTLGKLIDYLKQPEFIDNVKRLFDLLVDIAGIFKFVIGAWMTLYKTFGPFINFLIRWQFLFTQIGYLMTPFVQLLGVGSTIGLFKGRGGSTSKAGIGAVAGSILAGRSFGKYSGNALTGGGLRRTAAIRNMRAINNAVGMEYMAANSAYMIANARMVRAEQIRNRLHYSIEQQKLSNPDERYRINKMSHARNRANLMAERQMAARGTAAEAAMFAWAARQNAGRRSMDVFNRYERIYGHAYRSSWWGRTGVAASRGFSAGRAALNLSSLGQMLLGGLRSVISGLATALGALTSPVGIAVAAVGGLAYAFYAAKKRIEEARIASEANYKRNTEYNKKINSVVNRNWVNTISSGKKMSLQEILNATNGIKTPGKPIVDPTLAHLAGASGAFQDYSAYMKNRSYNDKNAYENFIAPVSKYLFGKNMSMSEVLAIGSMRNGSYNYGSQNNIWRYARQAGALKAAFDAPSTLKEFNNLDSMLANWMSASGDERNGRLGALMRQLNFYQLQHSSWKNGVGEHIFDGRDLSKIRSSEALNSYEGQKAIWEKLQEMRELIQAIDGSLNKNGTDQTESLNRLLNYYSESVGLPINFSGLKPDWDGLYRVLAENGLKYENTETERKSFLQLIIDRLLSIDPRMAEILKNVIDINEMAKRDTPTYVFGISNAYGAGANWGLPTVVTPNKTAVPFKPGPIQLPKFGGGNTKKGVNYLSPDWLSGATSMNEINDSYQGSYAQNSGRSSGPSSMTFNTPLVNINSIQGGEGVNGEQLANAVGDRVVDALKMVMNQTYG